MDDQNLTQETKDPAKSAIELLDERFVALESEFQAFKSAVHKHLSGSQEWRALFGKSTQSSGLD